MAAWREAQERKRSAIMTPHAYFEQQAALEKLKGELDRLERTRDELAVERARLFLGSSAVPLLSDRKRLCEARSALGPGPVLPEGARTQRQKAELELARLRVELDHHRQRLAELGRKRSSLSIPEALLGLSEQDANHLRDRLGSKRKADQDLPKRRAELAQLEAEARALREQLGARAAELASARRATLLRASIEPLARERVGLDKGIEEATATVLRSEGAVRRAEQRLAELGSAPAPEPLERALAEAEGAAALDAELERAQSDVARLEQAVADALRTLGSSAPRSSLPSREVLPGFEKRFAELEKKRDKHEQDKDRAGARLALAEQNLDRLGRAGAVPSEKELLAARAERQRVWLELAEMARAGSKIPEELCATFLRELERADEIADRLRREAGRVAELGAAEAERDAAERALTKLDAAERELVAEQRALAEEWAELWRESGVQAGAPSEMGGWLAKHEALCESLAELARARERLEATKRRAERAQRVLANALAAVGVEAPVGASCRVLAAFAERQRQRLADAQQRREQLRAALADAKHELDQATVRRDALREALEDWRRRWSVALEPLGLMATTTPEEAGVVLERLGELETTLARAEREARSVHGIERDDRELAALVSELTRKHAPDLSDLPTVVAAERLIKLASDARSAAEQARAIDAEMLAAERRSAELGLAVARLEAELDLLVRRAGVARVEELEAAERRSDQIRAIEAALAEVDHKLDELLEGRTLEALAEEVSGLDVQQARRQMEDVNEQWEALAQRRAELKSEIARVRSWLDERVRSVEAVDAEAAVQRKSAEIRAGIEKWARLELARAILRREVERYREKNQGPVLSRANELFSVLTCGEWSAIFPDIDANGNTSLACCRADGERVPLAGLSTGTKDPLYLALRLASIEHHAHSSEPLPLVLDDVLSELDEPRTSAALLALASVAEHLQVLLFTHHARHVELAARALPAERLRVVELPRRPGRAAAR
jgi:uncharacterized protein YhaN